MKRSTGVWLVGIAIYLGGALAISEILVRVLLSVPAVSDRVSRIGPHGWLIGNLERYGWRRLTGAGWDYEGQFEHHARWGWVSSPGTYVLNGAAITTNAERIRSGHIHGLVKPPGLMRIEVFGDSFAYGAEVGDDAPFAARLEREGEHLEVLNFGVPGYGLDQVYLRFQDDGRRYSPDVVVINLMHLLLTRSDTRFGSWYKPYFTREGDELALHGVPVPSPEETYRSFLYGPRLLDLVHIITDSEIVPYSKGLHELLLAKLGREILAAGARAIVVLAPAPYELESEDVYSNVAGFASAICAQEHLECLDVFPAFRRAAAAGTPLEAGVHWNGAGHEIVAQALLGHLKGNPSAPVQPLSRVM